MEKRLLLLIFILSTTIATPQANELIYKKIIPGIAQKFEPFTDNSGYGLYLSWTNPNAEA